MQPKVKYRQPPLLFRNMGKGQFADVSNSAGPDFSRPMVGRGAAYADIDHDGDLDILITGNAGPAVLLRNDGGSRNHWLRVKLTGTKSNRGGIGAVVRVKTPAGVQSRTVHSGSSYCSQSELVLTFGLGQDTRVSEVEVAWPSGVAQRIASPKTSQTIEIIESR